jgi:hypothetical protein
MYQTQSNEQLGAFWNEKSGNGEIWVLKQEAMRHLLTQRPSTVTYQRRYSAIDFFVDQQSLAMGTTHTLPHLGYCIAPHPIQRTRFFASWKLTHPPNNSWGLKTVGIPREWLNEEWHWQPYRFGC